VFSAIERASTDREIVGRNGCISEPYRTVLSLRLLGKRPVMALRIIDILKKHAAEMRGQEAGLARSEIARRLGKEHQSGTPYVELGKYLDSLVILDILESVQTRKKAGYAVGTVGLHLTPATASTMLAGAQPTWDAEDIYQLIEGQLLTHTKMRNMDGTYEHHAPSEFIEAMVRAGCDFKTALRILHELSSVESAMKLMTEFRRLIADKLERHLSQVVAHDFIKQQPLGIVLVHGDFDGQQLDYDLTRKLVLRVIGQHGFHCLPSNVLIDTTTTFLRLVMKDKLESVEESVLLDKLSRLFYAVYQMDLEALASSPPDLIDRSKRLLDTFESVVSVGPSGRDIGLARSSLHSVFCALLIVNGILPEATEEKTLQLAKQIVGDSSGVLSGSNGIEDPAKDSAYPSDEFSEAVSRIKAYLQQNGCLEPAGSVLTNLTIEESDPKLDTKSVVDNIRSLLRSVGALLAERPTGEVVGNSTSGLAKK